MLGAYRLDDRTPDEFTALATHLLACEACRAVEVSFRRVGALVRHLPSTVPPPSFRESVFAAIAADQRRLAKYGAGRSRRESPAERLARAATDPGLPVVRARPRPRHHDRRRPAMPHTPPAAAVAAVAAVLLLALVGTRPLPGSNQSLFGNMLGGLFGPRVARYMPSGRFSAAASALATGGWLVYSAADRGGQIMLLARDRASGATLNLLSAPERTPITVRALTNTWAIWSEGADDASSDWHLCASRLPGAGAHVAAPVLLARNANLAGDSSGDAPVQLTGVWAGDAPAASLPPGKDGTFVLLTALTRDGTSKLLRIELTDGQPVVRVLARASAPDRLLTSPSWDGGAYLWSEVWIGADGRLHSTIWRGDDAGHAQPLSGDDEAFAPRSASGLLLWIEETRNAAMPQASGGGGSAADLAFVARAAEAVRGALDARPLRGGRTWQLASSVEAGTLQAAGPFVLWRARDGSAAGEMEHAYDLRAHAASAADAQVRAAHFAGADGAALTWGERSGAIAVLDR